MTNSDERPTPERPFLVGLLIDVSASMNSAIQNSSGRSTTRLESVTDSLDRLIQKAKELSIEEGETRIAPLIKVFAYGFGFGNPIQMLFGRRGPDVRNLLGLRGEEHCIVSIDELADNWPSRQPLRF